MLLQYQKQEKKFQSIVIQTECLTNDNSESLLICETQPQTNKKKKLSKQPKTPTETTSSKPTTTKLPLHKQTIENTLNKKQEKQGRKSNSQKPISNTYKSTVSHKNPTKN